MAAPETPAPIAVMGGQVLTDLIDQTSDLAALDSCGTWAVLLPFDDVPVCARFATRRPWVARSARRWPGLGGHARWVSSLDASAFAEGVRSIRDQIAAGEVYQVNLTRRLHTTLPKGADLLSLFAALDRGNPAPHAAVLSLPDAGVAVASASPERFLARQGRAVWSSPIKGTAADPAGFLDKDRAENVMITDLVRNDLGRVCEWGSVEVPALCSVERHPGLAHLVSTVTGVLRADVGWPELIDATFPPGSVTGAPKLAALTRIAALEPVARGPYCGALGWIDADRGLGDLAVTIRTFWFAEGELCFGTGGAITWGSDPDGEWTETELKAANLLAVAAAVGR